MKLRNIWLLFTISFLFLINLLFPAIIYSLSERNIEILFFGDMMFDRYVRQKISQKGCEYLFAKISPLLNNCDSVVANLEGPITNFKPKPLNPKNVIFTFDIGITKCLKQNNINIVSLANNHTINFGQNGILQTKQALKKEEIWFFGDPLNKNDIFKIIEIKNMTFGFIGYHDLYAQNEKYLMAQIKTLKSNVDFLILFIHWGKEYHLDCSHEQRIKAHKYINAGLDLIIGAHPHVIQPVEIYKDKLIFYSLGNFIFDQFFSENVRTGLCIKMKLYEKELYYQLIPFRNVNFMITLMPESDKAVLIKSIFDRSILDQENRQSFLKNGLIKMNINN